MSFPKSKKNKTSQQKWKDFKQDHSSLIEKIGIPLDYLEKEDLWVDFLMHGYLDHHTDLIGFTTEKMNEKEYSSFSVLIDKYFEYGFDFFTPMALSTVDEQKILAKKYYKI